MTDIPRRVCLDRLTPAERAIYDAVQAVEAVGADVRLTDAVILLGAARDAVADYVDGSPLKRRLVRSTTWNDARIMHALHDIRDTLDIFVTDEDGLNICRFCGQPCRDLAEYNTLDWHDADCIYRVVCEESFDLSVVSRSE